MDHPTQPEFPALVIDGSSASTFVGIIGVSGDWLAKTRSDSAPLESLFETVKKVLEEAETPFESIRSYIYSEGPGSVLGLRLCAMAIETWSRLYPQSAHLFAYNSLSLVAEDLIRTNPDMTEALLLSDWKKAAWNAVKISDGIAAECTSVPTEELENCDCPIFHLPARKGWQEAPAGATTVNDCPEALPDLIRTAKVLKATEGVELYNSGANTFQKWTPERHR